MKPITDEIADLRSMTASDLATRYEVVFGKPPRIKHREYLWKRIAWKLQEQRFGGLSTLAKARLEELIAEIDIPLVERTRGVTGKLAQVSNAPAVGSVITREWHGRSIIVRVVDGGFEFDSVVYKSLSAVATAVTGSHWDGNLFFGLKPRKKAQ